MTLRAAAIAALVATVLAGCAGKKPVVPADQLWTEGNESFDDEAYDYAIQKYKALLDQYPFDPHAEEAELKIAQAYYAAERYPEAIAAFSSSWEIDGASPPARTAAAARKRNANRVDRIFFMARAP